jgi:hypothetical protein
MQNISKEDYLASIRSLAQNATFWKERAEAAEKACAEMRDALCEAETFMNFGVAPDFEAKILAKIQNALKCDCGRAYISLNDPVIVGLVECLRYAIDEIPFFGEAVNDEGCEKALAAYEARKQSIS